MATTTVETFSTATTSTATIPRPRRVCFSFAAYAKNVIGHLKTYNVPIDHGLTDSEFSAIESTFNFTFPPDLRSILQEGLPVGLGFPNWRSSSTQQLQILTNLPVLGICKQVSAHNFWLHSWGHKPNDLDQAVKIARTFLKRSAPFLVPIYRNCYIPSTPNLAGNPVFYVEGGDVRLSSFDVAGFFQQVDFRLKDGRWRGPSLSNLSNAPAWAATEARRIEFWTEMVERGESVAAAIGNTRGWWSGDLGGYLEEVCLRLKNGGWKEEEVREMMTMDGGEALDHNEGHKEGVAWHVQILSLSLLRAGWSTEDVVDSLGCDIENENGLFPDEESWFDFQHTHSCLLKVET